MARSVSAEMKALDAGAADVEDAFLELRNSAGPGLAPALKKALTQARLHARELTRSKGGRASGEFMARTWDRMLRELLSLAAQKAGRQPEQTGVALLAMGSYGRKDLAPFSDLDLLILHRGRVPTPAVPAPASNAALPIVPATPDLEGPGSVDPALEVLIGALLRPLWDVGLQVGHAVRTPDECLLVMEDPSDPEKALETATSLLEARPVAGDIELSRNFLEFGLAAFFKKRGGPFVEAKVREAVARHGRQGGGASVYRTQPNLKENPGALRDYQLALWIGRASLLSGHLPKLADRPLASDEAIEEARQGYEKILTFRSALHSVCGRKQDVLDYQMQQAVAVELNYEGVDALRSSELLLRDYFKSSTSVYRLADSVIRRYREEQAIAARDIEQIRRRPLDGDYTRIGHYLYMANPDPYSGPDWLAVAMRAFLHCARLGVSISQEIREALREQLHRIDQAARRDPKAASIFLDILRRRAQIAPAVSRMRDTGLLGEYMPEFGEIQSLVVHDIYHDFTVDEHTLFLLYFVDAIYSEHPTSHTQRLRRRALERLGRPEILRLACLFHDLGKSRGGAGHSKRGAVMVPQIAERLGLNQADTRVLIFLVEEHLLLSKTSLRRDTGDSKMLAELAAKIGSLERLDLLYLLTWADSSAVGQGSFTQWKDELLGELYQRLEELLGQPGTSTDDTSAPVKPVPPPAPTVELEAQLLALARDDDERARIREHCSKVPPRYLVEIGVEEARWHLELLNKMQSAPPLFAPASGAPEKPREALVAVRGSGNLVDLWIVSSDRPKRFAQICGAFLGLGAGIVSAIAYTRSDGLILDHFRINAPAHLGDKADSEYWDKTAAEIEQALAGQATDMRAKIEAVRKRIPSAPKLARSMEPDVRIDNKISDDYTVIDVICGDRIGLLYGLSRALADLGCNIHFAKVETNQGLAIDVFYCTEEIGKKILDSEKGRNIQLLLSAVAADFQAARR